MFSFRLQSVLDFRKQVEDGHLAEFARVRRRLDHEMERLSRIMEDTMRMMNHLMMIGKGDIQPGDIALVKSYIKSLRELERRQQAVIETVKLELEDKRAELLEAVKQRKIMENLRERRFEAYKSEAQKRELKELDERGIINAHKGDGR
ncbi:MAG: flagellar export protein FliJ [Deltaproteobacteria bacterium]|nr:flagellar export protein FliJ [Deltaproteobacteria bacterium]